MVPDRLARRPTFPSRHDAVLAGMPLAFLVGYLLGQQLFASAAPSVVTASAASGAVAVEGLFRRPPRGE